MPSETYRCLSDASRCLLMLPSASQVPSRCLRMPPDASQMPPDATRCLQKSLRYLQMCIIILRSVWGHAPEYLQSIIHGLWSISVQSIVYSLRPQSIVYSTWSQSTLYSLWSQPRVHHSLQSMVYSLQCIVYRIWFRVYVISISLAR